MLTPVWVCSLLLLLVLGDACARSGSARLPGCASDFDCKGDRVCVAGQCMGELGASTDADGFPDGEGGRGGSAGAAGIAGRSGAPPVAGRRAGETPLAGRAATGGSSAPPPSCSGRACNMDSEELAPGLHALPIAARALAVDTQRGLLYASVGGDADAHANSLVWIDPSSRQVLGEVAVGSEPNSLALAEDGSTLWVGLSGAYALRKVTLGQGDPLPEEQYTLPPGDHGDLAWAGPMVVLPGTHDSLAISLHRSGVSPSFAGVVIVDGGHPRPKQTGGHTGASRLTLGPEGFVFGYNNLHTGFAFYSLAIDPEGVTQTEHSDLISGFNSDIVYAAPYVYASSGEVVDVSDPSQPQRAGTFAISGSMAVGGEGQVLTVSAGTSGPLRLHKLDTATFTEIDSVLLSTDSISQVRNLVHAAPGVLAFIAQRDRESALYILDNADFVF